MKPSVLLGIVVAAVMGVAVVQSQEQTPRGGRVQPLLGVGERTAGDEQQRQRRRVLRRLGPS